VIVLLIGTAVLPILNSPLVISEYVHSVTPGNVVGHVANLAKIPFGVAIAGEATLNAAMTASDAMTALTLVFLVIDFICSSHL
jgi:hypothetical protein